MGFRWKQKVFRATNGSIDEDGMVVDPNYDEVEIMATVQPLRANEAAQYTNANQNGEFTVGAIKIYSDSPLIASKQGDSETGQEWPDVIPWQGKYYKVIMCDAYQANVISHYKSIAQEVDFDGSINSTEVSP